MSSTEDYLDRLLRGVTGEPEPEPEVVLEPEIIPEPETIQNQNETISDVQNDNILEVNFSAPVNTDVDSLLSDLPKFEDDPSNTTSLEDLISKEIISEIPIYADDAVPTEVSSPAEDNITIDNGLSFAEPSVIQDNFDENIPEEKIPEDITLVSNEPLFADDATPVESTVVLDEIIPDFDLPGDELPQDEGSVENLLSDVLPVGEMPIAPEMPSENVENDGFTSFEENLDSDALFNLEADTVNDSIEIEEGAIADVPIQAEDVAISEELTQMEGGTLNEEPVQLDEISFGDELGQLEELNVSEELNPIEDVKSSDEINLVSDIDSFELVDLEDEMNLNADPVSLEQETSELEMTESEMTDSEMKDLDLQDLDVSDLDSPVLENAEPEILDMQTPDSEIPDSEIPDSGVSDLEVSDLDAVDLDIPDSIMPDLEAEDSGITGLETSDINTSDLDDIIADDSSDDIEQDGALLNEMLSEEPSEDESSSSEVSEELNTFDELGSLDLGEDLLGDVGVKPEENTDNNYDSDLEDDEIASLLMDIENMGREDALNDLMSSKADESLDNLLFDSNDADMSEIGDILAKDESNELLDDFAFNSDMGFGDNMMSEDELFGSDEDDEESDKKKKKAKKKKEKKEKKPKKSKKSNNTDDADTEIDEIREKKPSFIKKILDMLLVSDDDEDIEEGTVFEETAVDIAIEGAAENEAILAEVEEDGGKKGKKKKKGKLSPEEKKLKKEEKQRQKEEKARLKAEKKALEDAQPKKKLPKKKVIPICILCFSLGVVITLLAFVMPSLTDKKKAVKQYQLHNYEAAYGYLKGHKLSKSEKLMYDRTVTLLQEERKLDSYHNYMVLDMKPEALNALVQGVKKYNELAERASELDVSDELDSIYSQIVSELKATFGLTVDKVSQWLNITDSEEYSYIINSYANGRGDDVIDVMESEDGNIEVGTVNVWDNSVISAEEAEIQ